jgi:hypothetical protein
MRPVLKNHNYVRGIPGTYQVYRTALSSLCCSAIRTGSKHWYGRPYSMPSTHTIQQDILRG